MYFEGKILQYLSDQRGGTHDIFSGGEANREPPVINWRMGGQILVYDTRSLDGERMHNGMKGLPCGMLMMYASKVVVTYVRYSGSVKPQGWPN